MLKVNWVISDQTITLNYNGQTHMLSRTDSYAPKLIAALKEKRFDDIPNLVSMAMRIEKFSNGKFVIKDGEILVDGVVAPAILGRKIKEFADDGLPYEPLVLFAKNLQKNPSYRATQELYQFLEKNNHPITDNGNFIAYKKVRENFLDVHTGTFDNSPGKTLEMPRSMVNEDPNQTCSHGLHVANFDYANNFYGGGIMLEVEVDPADVVAIPIDYNQSKMRVCKYKVLGVVKAELSSPLRKTREEDTSEVVELDECDHCGEENESVEHRFECGMTLCDDCAEEIDCDDEGDEYPWNEELNT